MYTYILVFWREIINVFKIINVIFTAGVCGWDNLCKRGCQLYKSCIGSIQAGTNWTRPRLNCKLNSYKFNGYNI